MVMVLWAVLDCNVWLAEAEILLAEWPRLTGRICPACGVQALVGHGRRQRSVHAGSKAGRLGPVCAVVKFWVQRVRCKACGRTHTLLPAFVARYQRHRSEVREEVTVRRGGGQSWVGVIKAMALPMLSATSPRRWVAGVLSRCSEATEEMRRWLTSEPVGPMPYAPTAASGSWQAFAETAGHALEGEGDWPLQERVAGANWLGGRRRSRLMV
jgi:Domain of unknown function (DUF6431)